MPNCIASVSTPMPELQWLILQECSEDSSSSPGPLSMFSIDMQELHTHDSDCLQLLAVLLG